MRLGAPMLRVLDLKESLEFYRGAFGLTVKTEYLEEDGLRVYELGFPTSSEPLLILRHDPNARLPRPDFGGLYHYAALVPTRKSLASTYQALRNSGVAFEGFADHTVSESLYLHDVEGNGIEIYADRPRETWSRFMTPPTSNRDADIRRFAALNKPLDFASLLGELGREESARPRPFPDGARIGHVHLRVTNLERSVEFYHTTLGLDIVANVPEIGAAFLSVGGYHHHIGMNTWHSQGGNQHTRGEQGLDKFTMFVPNKQVLDQLRSRLPALSHGMREEGGGLLAADPDGIEIEFRVGKQTSPRVPEI
jgi:catechol 2,3-dioxygenase